VIRDPETGAEVPFPLPAGCRPRQPEHGVQAMRNMTGRPWSASVRPSKRPALKAGEERGRPQRITIRTSGFRIGSARNGWGSRTTRSGGIPRCTGAERISYRRRTRTVNAAGAVSSPGTSSAADRAGSGLGRQRMPRSEASGTRTRAERSAVGDSTGSVDGWLFGEQPGS
jgi:hypothetical protein